MTNKVHQHRLHHHGSHRDITFHHPVDRIKIDALDIDLRPAECQITLDIVLVCFCLYSPSAHFVLNISSFQIVYCLISVLNFRM